MKYYLFLIFFICYSSFNAQTSVFYSSETNASFNLEKFGLEVYNLNFIKNNEYFNFIADGLTLLGTQLHPEFVYNNSAKTQFKAGLFLIKNFGENNIETVIPTFSFNYLNKNHQYTIGNLFARNNHNLIEPMMASEKILGNEVIETGIEYKYNSDKTNLDLWMNWENYIQKNDDFREVFTMGGATKLPILKKLSLPIQFIYYHKGGQINKKYRDANNQDNTSNLTNASIGIEFNDLNSLKNGFSLGAYYLSHKVNSEMEYPYKKGKAYYITSSYSTKSFNFLLAYYTADKFVSAKGNEMFQTYSLKSNVNYWNGVLDNRYIGYKEPERSLIFSKIYYKKQLASNVVLGLQFEGYYQLNDSSEILYSIGNKKHQFDYSYSFYITFNDVFSF